MRVSFINLLGQNQIPGRGCGGLPAHLLEQAFPSRQAWWRAERAVLAETLAVSLHSTYT